MSLVDLLEHLQQQHSLKEADALTVLEPLLWLTRLVKGHEVDWASVAVAELLRHTDILLYYYRQQAVAAGARDAKRAAAAATQTGRLRALLQLPIMQQLGVGAGRMQQLQDTVQAAHMELCTAEAATVVTVMPAPQAAALQQVIREAAWEREDHAEPSSTPAAACVSTAAVTAHRASAASCNTAGLPAGSRHNLAAPSKAVLAPRGVLAPAQAPQVPLAEMPLQLHQDAGSARAAALRKRERRPSVKAAEAAEVGQWPLSRPVKVSRLTASLMMQVLSSRRSVAHRQQPAASTPAAAKLPPAAALAQALGLGVMPLAQKAVYQQPAAGPMATAASPAGASAASSGRGNTQGGRHDTTATGATAATAYPPLSADSCFLSPYANPGRPCNIQKGHGGAVTGTSSAVSHGSQLYNSRTPTSRLAVMSARDLIQLFNIQSATAGTDAAAAAQTGVPSAATEVLAAIAAAAATGGTPVASSMLSLPEAALSALAAAAQAAAGHNTDPTAAAFPGFQQPQPVQYSESGRRQTIQPAVVQHAHAGAASATPAAAAAVPAWAPPARQPLQHIMPGQPGALSSRNMVMAGVAARLQNSSSRACNPQFEPAATGRE